ncbi:toprim domain-containing protein [Lichenihabitans sp. PAMC28606]|uniref:DUF5906 domain-containing protein n=1 Tax=Lichenihabitans sp. PAMC28606 TaxID=2880932 RepID=UPI001D0A4AE5|nr:DUF5906 domain-containing protein [Lichenihabitans sp. PAMC28606]UDL95816.1 toprim domain-containing protein [Lichenihabitans sp. PAMC28606]
MSLGLNNTVNNPETYARRAMEAECSIVASTAHGRNIQLNRSAFAIGQFVGNGVLDRSEAERKLFSAAMACGYVDKDGPAEARATIASGLDNGIREPRSNIGNGAARQSGASIHPLKPAPKLADVPVPDWTQPREDGKPQFFAIGKGEPPQFDDDLRRHVYWRDSAAVRVKVKKEAGTPPWIDYYRVRRPDDGAIGWQAKKPDGFVPVPYIGPAGTNSPFAPEHHGKPLFWTEGEKDADTIVRAGGLAFTFGGSSDVLDCSDLLRGFVIVIVADNDLAGEKCAERKVAMAQRAGLVPKVVRFADMMAGADASDFLATGSTLDDLLNRAECPGQDNPEPAQENTAPAEEDELAELNCKFCVVLDGGKAQVLHFEQARQKDHAREVASFLSFENFRNFYLNRTIRVGDKNVSLGHWWLRHPERRQYRGLTFQPAGSTEIDGRLNLWRGWGVPSAPGRWSRMRHHIEDVLASGHPDHAAYILKWCAWAVQHPADRAQAAIVFRGRKGTGKGTLGNALCHMFGQHGTHISSAEHLAGRFNGHLRDVCFLFADEAFWPGDRSAEGSLKRLITEPDLFIEDKGVRGVTVPNMLHVMMASNEDWIVPAGEDERRYVVFDVADTHKQSEAWFQPIYDEMDAGGFGAMLHDLLNMDLGNWHPRRIVRTEALVQQQSQGLRPEEAWWCELLQSGVLWGSEGGGCAVSNGWEEKQETFGGTSTVRRKGLYDQAREISPRLRLHSDHLLGRFLASQGCDNAQKIQRRRGWTFPPLAECRAAWEARFPGWQWDRLDLLEWEDPVE